MNFKKQPWKHQLEAIARCEDINRFGLFFEMGTGKTGTAINILRMRAEKAGGTLPRTLIFCPPVVVENWKREFAIHSEIPKSKIICLTGPGSKRLETFRKHK